MTSLQLINELRASVQPADPEARFDPDRLWYLAILAVPVPFVRGDLRPQARHLRNTVFPTETPMAPNALERLPHD